MSWQVVKENEIGDEVWRYEGQVIVQNNTAILIDARFNRDDFVFNGMPLNRGDRFVEAYFQDRWFNIMQIYQGESDHLKGWYCNVTFPAFICGNEVHYRDLALDVLVFADRHYLVLDEDEFDELALPEEIKKKARSSVGEILLLFETNDFQPVQGWFENV